jgi:hypothetical protein
MAENPIRAAASAESGVVKDTLLEAIVKRFGYTLNVGESLGDVDFDVGQPPLCVLSVATGFTYFLDTSDSTTADDGVTCLVSGDGRRYHIQDSASIVTSSVLAEQNDPPDEPSDGDAYIVSTAPTGDWAAHATDIAVYTRRGWVFLTPDIGMTVYNQATGANRQFDENGDWVEFAADVADNSIVPAKLKFPLGVSVEAQQNAPPAVSAGPHYLVGTAGSGDWSGHSNEVAYSTDGSTWSFIAAYEGARVYNKDTNRWMYWDGSAWQSFAPGVLDRQTFTTAGAATWTKPTGVPTNAMAFIQLWGGGGAGGASIGTTDGTGGGGGGGAYVEAWLPVSALGSTETVTVGAGGATSAADGGNTTFGSWLTAYGGQGGTNSATGNRAAGGGGGGALSSGSANTGGNPQDGGAHGGAAGGADNGNAGSSALFGGGGGGAGQRAGGSSLWGGGGGGGGGNSTNPAGGTSKFGGNGGAGAAATGQTGAAGSAPGGGGGAGGITNGTVGANGGAGARGEARVTIFG